MGFSLKKLASPITRSVRGVGRLARGKFREGFHDIGSSLEKAAPALGFIPGVGTLAAVGLGAAGGAMERGARGGVNLRNLGRGALTGAARGAAGEAAQGGLKMLGRATGVLKGKGAGDVATAGGTRLSTLGKLGKFGKGALDLAGKIPGALDKFGNVLEGAAPYAAGAALIPLWKQMQADAERGSAFEQGRFDLLKASLAEAEKDYASRAPLRGAGQGAALGALGAPADIFSSYLGAQQRGEIQPGSLYDRVNLTPRDVLAEGAATPVAGEGVGAVGATFGGVAGPSGGGGLAALVKGLGKKRTSTTSGESTGNGGGGAGNQPRIK